MTSRVFIKKIILSLIISLIYVNAWTQKKEAENLMTLGNTEFEAKNYINAKDYYESSLRIDPKSKKALYNLAVTEIYLENIGRACELLQKGYKLKDINTREMILEYCGEVEYNKTMFLQDVDGTPQFEYKRKIFPLIVNKTMNPKLLSMFKTEARNSLILRKYKGKRIFVNFIMINSHGFLSCKTTENYMDEVKPEIERIFNNLVSYKPLTFKGKKVDVWGMGFPVFFEF